MPVPELLSPMADQTLWLPETPVLIYKVGAPCDLPPDFAPELAYTLGAELADREMAKDLLLEEGQYGRNKHGVRRALHRLVSVQLKRGNDVVVDSFYGGPEPRENIGRVAHRAGALAIAVNVTTSQEVIAGRLRLLGADGSTNALRSTADLLVSAANARNDITRADASEPRVDFVLSVVGDGDADSVITQIEKQMAGHGLLDNADTNGSVASLVEV